LKRKKIYIKEEDIVNIKELFITRESEIKYRLNGIQNSIINFCKNYNMLQTKENFFNLNIKDQFEFNECVDYVGTKIKADYKEMEKFYTKCKAKCISDYKFKADEIRDGIEQYNEASLEIIRPRLHPCISDCMDLYHYLSVKYYTYMVKDSGIYAEFVDYKKNIV